MKAIKVLVLVLLLVGSTTLYAQNVGIGNANPDFKLDLSGRMRIRGGNSNTVSAGIWLSGWGVDSVTNRMFIGMESDSAAGLYSEIAGSNGWFFVADAKNARIGIRNRNPKYPLSFNNVTGDKISLYSEFNGKYFGLGVGNSTLQLLVPDIFASTVFGHGLSDNFTETMRIKGDGIVGIGESNPTIAGLVVNKLVGATHAVFGSNTLGVAIESANPGIGFNSYYNGARKAIAAGYTGYIGVSPTVGGMSFLVSGQSLAKDATGTYNTAIDIKPDGKIGIGVTDPAYLLDLAGRMRIRGAIGFTAGLWLNNEANSISPAFIGMKSDNEVGFYGSGTGWSLIMNTQTGAMAFGGNAGQPGQVLTSNGTAAAPAWRNMGGGTHAEAFQTSNLSVSSNSSGFITVPGMEANFTLTTTSRVVFNARLMLSISSCFACAPNRTYIALRKVVPGGYEEHMILPKTTPEGAIDTFSSGPIVLNLAAGSYTYVLALRNFGPTSSVTAIMTTIGGLTYPGVLTWQIFPN